MQVNPSKTKNGSTLVIVMIMVIAFSLMITALLQLGALGEQETVKQLRISQSHWLAEAGLERALSWVAASEDFRLGLSGSHQSFGPYSELPSGDYEMELWTTSASNIVIRSTGSTAVGTLDDSATVEFSIHYVEGIPHTIEGGLEIPGSVYLGDDVLAAGDVFGNDTLEVDGDVNSNYSAYATTLPITGDGNYTENALAASDSPVVDSDGTFAGYLATAASQTNTTFEGTLSGTVYVNGDLTLDDGISGSGTLVVTGDLIFEGVDNSVADNIDVVVEGNITVNNHTSFGDHVEIFSQNGNISLQHDIDGGTVAFIAKNGSLGHIEPEYDNSLGTIDTAHLLTSGHSIGDQNPSKPDFNGLFYAGYDIIFRHKGDIYGAVLAGRHINIGHTKSPETMRITSDPSVFDEDWQIDFGNSIVITSSKWREL